LWQERFRSIISAEQFGVMGGIEMPTEKLIPPSEKNLALLLISKVRGLLFRNSK